MPCVELMVIQMPTMIELLQTQIMPSNVYMILAILYVAITAKLVWDAWRKGTIRHFSTEVLDGLFKSLFGFWLIGQIIDLSSIMTASLGLVGQVFIALVQFAIFVYAGPYLTATLLSYALFGVPEVIGRA